jgi:hypothetical protein
LICDRHRGRKEEFRAVVGITHQGRVQPLGCFANTQWPPIEDIIKKRIKKNGQHPLPFVYDGEPGLDTFLSDIAESQRCSWHAPRGLYHALQQENLKKKDSRPHMDKIRGLIGIELPEGE